MENTKSLRQKCIVLEDEVNELKHENRQLQDRNHWLEGKVEAFEFCIKNGREK